MWWWLNIYEIFLLLTISYDSLNNVVIIFVLVDLKNMYWMWSNALLKEGIVLELKFDTSDDIYFCYQVLMPF